MATKRTPIGRQPSVTVTPQMVHLWRMLTRGKLTRERRIDAEIEPYRLAKREPWQKALTDIDPDAEDPTGEDLLSARGIDGWYAGRDLVRALEETVAAGET